MRQLAVTCFVLSLWASTAVAACDHRLDELADLGVKASRPITAEQVERLNMVVMHEEGRTYITPFGENHAKWIAFKSSLKSFDRFVAFDASPQLAAQLGIRLDGHAIVRGKCVVGFLKSATR
ncbi:MAG: hypothetical protein AB7P37_11255 [Ramlibacter sp.]